MGHLDRLDRLPTMRERVGGAVASLLIFAFAVAVIAFVVYWLLRRPQPINAVVVAVVCGFALLALWGAYMFAKFVWGTPRAPSPLGQLVVGLVATVGAAVYLVTAFWSGRQIQPFTGTAMATMFVSGIVWSRHAWKQLRAHQA